MGWIYLKLCKVLVIAGKFLMNFRANKEENKTVLVTLVLGIRAILCTYVSTYFFYDFAVPVKNI